MKSADALASLQPIFEKKGLTDNIVDFHDRVNVIYHDIESRYYDRLHQEMWESLPQQFDRLIQMFPDDATRSDAVLLDVGCGTGLATDIFLQKTGNRITEVVLLDSSPKMLSEAVRRSKKWGIKVDSKNIDLSELTGAFDYILVSSVLHHIPDLTAFMKSLSARLKPNGILITIHDPISETVNGDQYAARCEELDSFTRKQGKYSIKRIKDSLLRRWNQLTGKADYIELINRALIKERIVHSPLSHGEIWSITDIHVEGLPYTAGNGISINLLRDIDHGLELVNYITYAFFGTMEYNLPPVFKKKEASLAQQNDPYGRNLGALWLKKNK